MQAIQLIFAKIFDFFKTKSPVLYAIFTAVALAAYYLNTAGVIHIPTWIVDILVSLGVISGVHTSGILKAANK